MSKLGVIDELYRGIRKNFKRRKYVMKAIDDTFQADLVEMIPYAKQNQNYKYVLVVIDTFSKYLWTRPLKNKTCAEVAKAMQSIFDSDKRIPKNIQTDMGKEFYGKQFKELMKHHKINHYSSYSELKASIVERVNRTILSMLWKELAMQGNHKWVKLFSTITTQYNQKKHRTLNMAPIEVNKQNEKRILNTVYKHNHTLNESSVPFKVNDIVRVSRYRSVFDKGYLMNYSTELFTIYKVLPTDPPTYLLMDSKNQKIKGCFYSFQLQKTKQPDVYLVEKILRKRGNKYYVKFLGFDNSENMWINKQDVI